jgi:hypothetical protein
MSRPQPQPDLVALLKQLGDGDPQTRCAAAAALERMRCHAEPAVAALTAALDDPDPRVVIAATRALRRSLGRWQTDQIIASQQRKYVATAKLVRQVASPNGHATPAAPLPGAKGPAPAKPARPRPERHARDRSFPEEFRLRVRALERAVGRAVGRRLNGLLAVLFYGLVVLALVALGRLHVLFITRSYDAPAVALVGGVATAVAIGGLLLAALARALGRPRGLWPAVTAVALLGLFVALSASGTLDSLVRQMAHAFPPR